MMKWQMRESAVWVLCWPMSSPHPHDRVWYRLCAPVTPTWFRPVWQLPKNTKIWLCILYSSLQSSTNEWEWQSAFGKLIFSDNKLAPLKNHLPLIVCDSQDFHYQCQQWQWFSFPFGLGLKLRQDKIGRIHGVAAAAVGRLKLICSGQHNLSAHSRPLMFIKWDLSTPWHCWGLDTVPVGCGGSKWLESSNVEWDLNRSVFYNSLKTMTMFWTNCFVSRCSTKPHYTIF